MQIQVLRKDSSIKSHNIPEKRAKQVDAFCIRILRFIPIRFEGKKYARNNTEEKK